MRDAAEDKQVRDSGSRKGAACHGFPSSHLWQSSNTASTHSQARLWQCLCFRLTVFANPCLFGENECKSMTQNTYCQYCHNRKVIFRSDPSPDLVHHNKKLVLTEKQTQKPQRHYRSRTDRRPSCNPEAHPTSSQWDLTPMDFGSDPDRLPWKSLGCNHMPAPGTRKSYLKTMGKNSWCSER